MPVLDLSEAGFDVQKVLGDAFGGVGHVFAARSKVHGRVACKVFAVDLFCQPCYEFSHIVEEVHWLKWLRHSHIVPFVQAAVLGRHLCIAMPLSDMGSALFIIKNAYPSGLPEKAIALILKQLLQAVEYLHKQNIIHRSIRASHILLDSVGGVRLSGFRHSLFLEGGRARSTGSFTDHLADSLLWLAPEVLAQDMCGYGTSSDIYSIGIALCEMGNGFPPFSDMDTLQMLYEKQRGTTPRLLDMTTMFGDDESEHRLRKFSDEFHDITEHCLRVNPAHRPPISTLLDHSLLKKVKRINLTALLPLTGCIPDKKDKDLQTTPASTASLEHEWNF